MTCNVVGMILLVTPSGRAQECAQALSIATGLPASVAATLEIAVSQLRSQGYAAVVVDQFLMESEPDQSSQLLEHLGGAIPICVNCAISGVERVVREVQSSLGRRKREVEAARWTAEKAVWSELRETVTALLLASDLAMSTPGTSEEAIEKIRVVYQLAHQLRSQLEHTMSPDSSLSARNGG